MNRCDGASSRLPTNMNSPPGGSSEAATGPDVTLIAEPAERELLTDDVTSVFLSS